MILATLQGGRGLHLTISKNCSEKGNIAMGRGGQREKAIVCAGTRTASSNIDWEFVNPRALAATEGGVGIRWASRGASQVGDLAWWTRNRNFEVNDITRGITASVTTTGVATTGTKLPREFVKSLCKSQKKLSVFLPSSSSVPISTPTSPSFFLSRKWRVFHSSLSSLPS